MRTIILIYYLLSKTEDVVYIFSFGVVAAITKTALLTMVSKR